MIQINVYIRSLMCLFSLSIVQHVYAQNHHETTVITLTPEQLEHYQFEIKDNDFTVKTLSVGQQTTLNRKRRLGNDLLARQLGILGIKGTKSDLKILQQVVDRNVLQPNQVEEWQALGVLFGDILVQEFGLAWVSYEDDLGTSKALRYAQTDNFVFPVSLFSKRTQFKEKIDMVEIYTDLEAKIRTFVTQENPLRLPGVNAVWVQIGLRLDE